MARQCELTGKKPTTGNTVSNANNRCKTRHFPNLKSKRLFLAPVNQIVRLTLSTDAIRTVDKHGGLAQALIHLDDRNFSDRARRYKKMIAHRI